MTRVRILPFGFVRIPGMVWGKLNLRGWVTIHPREKENKIVISEWPEPLSKSISMPWVPEMSAIHHHKCMEMLQTATSSVMIVDPHFLQPEYEKNATILASFIPYGIDTKIIACKGGTIPEEIKSYLSAVEAWQIVSSKDSSAFLHDRFVIVDGERGLHFGNALAYDGPGIVLITEMNQHDCQTLSKEITAFIRHGHHRQDLVKIRKL